MSKELELLAAVKEADIETIKKLIKAGAKVNYKDKDKESYGYTWPLLHHCIFKENGQRKKEYVTAAELLLENGADIEGVNHTGETPALFAIKYFSPDIFELLIQKGANINAKNKKGYNQYDIVLDRYYYDQELDLEHIDEETDKKVKSAIKKGEGPALDYMFERIDTLVKNGYDLDAGKYSAPLCALFEIAKEKLPVKALFYLFGKGADPRQYIRPEGGEPYPLFAYVVDKEILSADMLTELAVRIGINYAFTEWENNTPLIIAIAHENYDLVVKLVESGADIHAEMEWALLSACDHNNLHIIKYLIEQGADINCVDKKGKTIWDYAKKDASLEVIKYLKSKYPELS